MQKLLILLILSFFSTQGYAASCPDGSEPVKSLSADGTYFVYNCGGGNEQTSSSTGFVNSKDRANSCVGQIPKNDEYGVENPPEVINSEKIGNVSFTQTLSHWGGNEPNGVFPLPNEQTYEHENNEYSAFERSLVDAYETISFENKDGSKDVAYFPGIHWKNPEFPMVFFKIHDDGAIEFKGISSTTYGMLLGHESIMVGGIKKYAIVDSGKELDTGNWPFGNVHIFEKYKDRFVDAGKLNSVRAFYHAIDVGDINGDDREDIVTVAFGIKPGAYDMSNIHVWLQNKDGEFCQSKNVLGKYGERGWWGPGSIELMDIDGDGDEDIILGQYKATDDARNIHKNVFIRFFENLGNMQFRLATEISRKEANSETLDWGIRDFETSDFDRDGDEDFIISLDAYNQGPVLRYFSNEGNMKFVNKTDQWFKKSNFRTQFGIRELHVVDYNNDGYDDLFINPSVGEAFFGYKRATTRKPYNIDLGAMIMVNLDGEGFHHLIDTDNLEIPYDKITYTTKKDGWPDSIVNLNFLKAGDNSLELFGLTNRSLNMAHFSIEDLLLPKELSTIKNRIKLKASRLEEQTITEKQKNEEQTDQQQSVEEESVEDEIAAFEASLAAEFGQEDSFNQQKLAKQQKISDEIKNYESDLATQGHNETKHSLKFKKSIQKYGKVVFEGSKSFTKFNKAIPLTQSGARLIGFKDLNLDKDGSWMTARVHLQYGQFNISTSLCLEYNYKVPMLFTRASFREHDWGGLKGISSIGQSGCGGDDNWVYIAHFQANDSKAKKLQEWGIEIVLIDLNVNDQIPILKAFDSNSCQDLGKLISLVYSGDRSTIDSSSNRAKIIDSDEIMTDEKKAECQAEYEAQRLAEEKRIAEETAIIAAQEQKVLDELAEFEAELAEENKSSPLFDGRYSFNLFRFHDDESEQKVGSGFVEIRNGEVIIDKDNSDLKTGSKDLYDTFSGQVNKHGKVSASMELDVLNGIDAPEFYEFDGSIKDKKIWGETAFKNSFKAYMLIAEENKSSPLFDGRYSFNLFLYHDDEDWQELGNGFVEIMNGEVMIDKDNRELKTGPTDLYDTFSGQIDEKGNVSGSVELAYLFGKDRSEVFTLNGQIDKKIWGDSPREDFFRVYMLLVKE